MKQHLSSEETWELMDFLIETVGVEQLWEECFRWMGTDMLQKFLKDFVRNYDLNEIVDEYFEEKEELNGRHCKPRKVGVKNSPMRKISVKKPVKKVVKKSIARKPTKRVVRR